jgi:hypothetical protein
LRVFGAGESGYFNTARSVEKELGDFVPELHPKPLSTPPRHAIHSFQTRSLELVRLQHANTIERHDNRAIAPGADYERRHSIAGIVEETR